MNLSKFINARLTTATNKKSLVQIGGGFFYAAIKSPLTQKMIDELLSRAAVASGMRHLPAQTFKLEFFFVKFDAVPLQHAANNFKIFIL